MESTGHKWSDTYGTENDDPHFNYELGAPKSLRKMDVPRWRYFEPGAKDRANISMMSVSSSNCYRTESSFMADVSESGKSLVEELYEPVEMPFIPIANMSTSDSEYIAPNPVENSSDTYDMNDLGRLLKLKPIRTRPKPLGLKPPANVFTAYMTQRQGNKLHKPVSTVKCKNPHVFKKKMIRSRSIKSGQIEKCQSNASSLKSRRSQMRATWVDIPPTVSVNYHPKNAMPRQIEAIPYEGDFRSYFELDKHSLAILTNFALLSNEVNEMDDRVDRYMIHFYLKRSEGRAESTSFHLNVYLGFYAAHLLLSENKYHLLPNESAVNSASREDFYAEMDERVLNYALEYNSAKKPKIEMKERNAKAMIKGYMGALLTNVKRWDSPMLQRELLCSRFAVFLIEQYCMEKGLNPLSLKFGCTELLEWAVQNEQNVSRIFNATLEKANSRAELPPKTVVLRQVNLQSVVDFYERGLLPRPDPLTLCRPNLTMRRRYELETMNYSAPLKMCPVSGCDELLSKEIFMAHFLTSHCLRMEELWLIDRMLLVFHPACYPAGYSYCLCVLALKQGKHNRMRIPRPLHVNNYELPSQYLYFSEHLPCMLMYSHVSMAHLQEHPVDDAPFDVMKSVYVFWLAIFQAVPPTVMCRMYIYSQEKVMHCDPVLNFVNMMEFKDVPHLMHNYEGSYLAIDHPTMIKLTKDFHELIYIDVRNIESKTYASFDSADENLYED